MKLEAEKNYGLTDVYFTSNFNGNIKLNVKTFKDLLCWPGVGGDKPLSTVLLSIL